VKLSVEPDVEREYVDPVSYRSYHTRPIPSYNRTNSVVTHMSETGIKPWSEDMTSRERIRKIATTITQPRSVNWVKKQASISSWETTKDELETLAEFGQVRIVEGEDGNVKYAPDYRRRYVDEVLDLIDKYSREELREKIANVQQRIDGWKQEYDVESKEDLESTLGELDAEEIHERNKVIRQWEHTQANKKLLNHAVRLHEDVDKETDPSVPA
jgi:hypothetical protein